MELETNIKNKLREVIDPEIGIDVVTLGLIRNISVEDGKANIGMILTFSGCPLAGYIMEMVKRKTLEVEGVKEAQVSLLQETWDPSMIEQTKK